jgi:hypothetical protein
VEVVRIGWGGEQVCAVCGIRLVLVLLVLLRLANDPVTRGVPAWRARKPRAARRLRHGVRTRMLRRARGESLYNWRARRRRTEQRRGRSRGGRTGVRLGLPRGVLPSSFREGVGIGVRRVRRGGRCGTLDVGVGVGGVFPLPVARRVFCECYAELLLGVRADGVDGHTDEHVSLVLCAPAIASRGRMRADEKRAHKPFG